MKKLLKFIFIFIVVSFIIIGFYYLLKKPKQKQTESVENTIESSTSNFRRFSENKISQTNGSILNDTLNPDYRFFISKQKLQIQNSKACSLELFSFNEFDACWKLSNLNLDFTINNNTKFRTLSEIKNICKNEEKCNSFNYASNANQTGFSASFYYQVDDFNFGEEKFNSFFDDSKNGFYQKLI
tara:strand:+ start:1533 stop:2084 length:552 start_codon:yes stop_codon:yes gene_type:complete